MATPYEYHRTEREFADRHHGYFGQRGQRPSGRTVLFVAAILAIVLGLLSLGNGLNSGQLTQKPDGAAAVEPHPNTE